MTNEADGQLTGLKIAVTVDDQFQWAGVPFPDGYSPRSVSVKMIEAFDAHGVTGVYAFNSTAPTDAHPSYLDILDDWCAAGHHVGSHTHEHLSLNWLDVDAYLRDVDAGEQILRQWIDAAPSRYFRYAFAMEGDTEDKTRRVQTHLTRTGFLSSPVTLWFWDAQFLAAYSRAVALSDRDALQWLEDTLVDTAITQIKNQVAAAAAAIGRSQAHILLIHGTAIAGQTIARILARLSDEGVVFITSEEALRDPANVIGPPLTTRQFRNTSQKWAELAGIPIKDVPPAVLEEVEETAVIDGMGFNDLMGGAIARCVQRIPCTPVVTDFQ